jgi:hypothetical protein
MNKIKVISMLAVFAATTCIFGAPKSTSTAQTVVTVNPPRNLNSNDIQVTADKDAAHVLNVAPLAQNGLQLWILIDDGSDQSVGLQFNDIRRFIQQQPANTEVGVAYMQYGDVKKVQDLTSDHELAAKALRLPLGRVAMSTSPYMSLSELIKKWPATDRTREVLMVTSGIDPYGPGPDDPYLLGAIDRAQHAGVIVNSIYFGAGGWTGWQRNWGQNNLARIAEDTGGRSFWLGTTNPVSFGPFLTELNQRLAGQYVVTFEANGKSGLQKIKVKSELPDTKVTAPTRVYIGS